MSAFQFSSYTGLAGSRLKPIGFSLARMALGKLLWRLGLYTTQSVSCRVERL